MKSTKKIMKQFLNEQNAPRGYKTLKKDKLKKIYEIYKMNVKDLKPLAKEKGIKQWYKMKAQELKSELAKLSLGKKMKLTKKNMKQFLNEHNVPRGYKTMRKKQMKKIYVIYKMKYPVLRHLAKENEIKQWYKMSAAELKFELAKLKMKNIVLPKKNNFTFHSRQSYKLTYTRTYKNPKNSSLKKMLQAIKYFLEENQKMKITKNKKLVSITLRFINNEEEFSNFWHWKVSEMGNNKETLDEVKVEEEYEEYENWRRRKRRKEYKYNENFEKYEDWKRKNGLDQLDDAPRGQTLSYYSVPKELMENGGENLNKLLYELKEKGMKYLEEGSDVFKQLDDIDPTWFKFVYLNKIVGGNAPPHINFDNGRNYKKLCIDGFDCKTQRGKNNNCLIECFRFAKKNELMKELKKELKKGLKKEELKKELKKRKVPTSSQIRKKLGFEKNKPLGMKIGEDKDHNDILKLENEFNLKACVITGRNEQGKLNILYGDSKKSDFWIMLKDEHFSIICKEAPKKLKKITKIQKQKPKLITNYYFFDYETIWDEHGTLKPYSLSYSKIRVDKRPIIKTKRKKITTTKTECIVGFDCSDKFVDVLAKDDRDTPANEDNVLISYNGSRFDHFILAESLAKEDLLSTRSLFIANGSILKLTFGTFRALDLCKFVMAPLKKACKDFGCKLNKLSFDHNEVQNAYNNGKFKEWLKKNKRKLMKYNNMDVNSMVELFFKIRSAFIKLMKRDIKSFMTLSQMGYDRWRELTPTSVVPSPKTIEDFKFFRSAVYAGRSQIFKHGHFKEIFQSIDVKSLYPFIMLFCEFPIGDYKRTEKFVENKLGIYKCIIYKQGKVNIIPKRSKNKPLDWTYKRKMKCTLTSVDINNFEKILINEDYDKKKHSKFNYVIKVLNGFYWEKSSKDVFRKYLEPFKDEKTKQDKIKSGEIDGVYNPAYRAVCKLSMNCLSGKVIQKLYDTLTVLCKDINQLTSFESKHEILSVSTLKNCESIYLKGKKKEYKYSPRFAKPCQLGVFIYSYARTHMYKSVLTKIDEKYAMDTDSLHIPVRVLKTLKDEGHGFGKYHQGTEFGDFENEIDFESKNVYYIAPKCYGIFGENKSKIRFKGIGTRDKIINLSQNKFNKLTTTEKYNLYLKSKPALSEELYKKLANGETVNLLSSQIKRNLGKNKLSSLNQVFVLKKVSASGVKQI